MYGENVGLSLAPACPTDYAKQAMPPQEEMPLYQALSSAHNRLSALNDHAGAMLRHIHGPGPSGCGNQTQPAAPPTLMEVKRYVLDEIARLEEQLQLVAAALS